MTSFPKIPETIEELDEQLQILHETMGRPANRKEAKEERDWLIELYELKEESDAE